MRVTRTVEQGYFVKQGRVEVGAGEWQKTLMSLGERTGDLCGE